jgi:hypothetical protein
MILDSLEEESESVPHQATGKSKFGRQASSTHIGLGASANNGGPPAAPVPSNANSDQSNIASTTAPTINTEQTSSSPTRPQSGGKPGNQKEDEEDADAGPAELGMPILPGRSISKQRGSLGATFDVARRPSFNEPIPEVEIDEDDQPLSMPPVPPIQARKSFVMFKGDEIEDLGMGRSIQIRRPSFNNDKMDPIMRRPSLGDAARRPSVGDEIMHQRRQSSVNAGPSTDPLTG